jgi:hypothetical protein
MPYIKLPNGVFCEIPEGMDPDIAMARAQDQFPDAFKGQEIRYECWEACRAFKFGWIAGDIIRFWIQSCS